MKKPSKLASILGGVIIGAAAMLPLSGCLEDVQVRSYRRTYHPTPYGQVQRRPIIRKPPVVIMGPPRVPYKTSPRINYFPKGHHSRSNNYSRQGCQPKKSYQHKSPTRKSAPMQRRARPTQKRESRPQMNRSRQRSEQRHQRSGRMFNGSKGIGSQRGHSR